MKVFNILIQAMKLQEVPVLASAYKVQKSFTLLGVKVEGKKGYEVNLIG